MINIDFVYFEIQIWLRILIENLYIFFISMGFKCDTIFDTRLLFELINKRIDVYVNILTAEIISLFGQIISCYIPECDNLIAPNM